MAAKFGRKSRIIAAQKTVCTRLAYASEKRMSGTAPGWTPVGSRGGGRWELLVFLLHLARFARALRGDWHRLGKRTDGFPWHNVDRASIC